MWTLEGFRFPASLVPRLTSAGDEREQLTARHLERARQCCFDLLGLGDRCAPSTRVLVAYSVLLHDALAVLASVGWRVAPSESHVDMEVLEVLATHADMKPRLSQGVRLVAATRERELYGSFANDEQARYIQATGLDVHGFVELQLEGFGTGSS